MDALLVLVVIPLYNARAYISRTLESVLSQTYENYKVLVIDDGSTDGSGEVVRSIKDDRIIVWEQENQGPGAAMNRAIQFAFEEDFPFIARADADDVQLPDRLLKQIDLLLRNPDAAACSANCYYVDEKTEKKIGKSTVPVSSHLIHWEINRGLRGLIQSACTFRTGALHDIGGYRSQIRQAEEADLFLRLVEKYRVVNSPDYLCMIRYRQDSLSMGNVRQNVEYLYFALDCARRRRKGVPELAFESFIREAGWYTRFLMRREEQLLRFWRMSFYSPTPIYPLLAALIDPRRVAARILRMIDSKIHQLKRETHV
jgi:glycosyltransferase involved in cell wall biosynthesis